MTILRNITTRISYVGVIVVNFTKVIVNSP